MGRLEELDLKKRELKIKELGLRIDKLLLEIAPRLVIPSIQDQSQKQPEGPTGNIGPTGWEFTCTKCGKVFPRKTQHECKPEKQEEWRRELDDLLEDYWGYPDQGTEEAFIRGEMGVFELVSQLLSERTFTFGELDMIREAFLTWNNSFRDGRTKELRKQTWEKILRLWKESKLLKEEE